MSKNWAKDINKMHRKYGVHDWVANASPFQLRKYIEFRFDFLKEEMDETREAIIYEDSEELVDGLIDLCVVAIGTLDAMGVSAHKAWNEVYKANMKKEVGVKESRPNPLGIPDLIKPEGWTAPSHEDNHGIIPTAFEPDIDKELDELVNQQAQDEIAFSTGKIEENPTEEIKEKYGRAVETMPEMFEDSSLLRNANNNWGGLFSAPDAPSHYTTSPGPLDGEREPIDFTKDSEYIRLYGKEGNKKDD